ncbi:MAG: NADH-quinone oxidoreductase subunit M [Methylococcaceae bacterium]|nr:NADH-quinone oxidoreductase subunit M [Methylococcaceae bacterium]
MSVLSLILWTPAVGALLLSLLPPERIRLIRSLAIGFATVAGVASWSLAFQFDGTAGEFRFGESTPWNPELGSSYALGLDGFALPMLMLGTLLTVIAVLASQSRQERVKGYHVCLLLLQFGIEGVFMARDWVLFYVFWEATLIPLFFLIDQWGGARRHTASLNFVLYTMGGSVFMLIALLAVYTASPEHSTAMDSMARAAAALPRGQQTLVLAGLLIGFGVKIPVFPLHGWLPLAHVEAPSPVSILLSGVLLKMGAYGLLRVVGMLPDGVAALQPLLLALALVSILYGGLLAWRQTDLKAMVAYSSISHMGVVVLGIACLNPAGLLGASLQMSAHGLVAGSLFLLVGLMYERTHTRELADYGCLAQQAPRFAVLTTTALLAALGLPGTAGFVAELHTLIGGLARWGWWVLPLLLSVLISAAYAVRTIVRLCTGPIRPATQRLADLRGHELVAACLLVAGILVLGVAPGPLIGIVSGAVENLAARFGEVHLLAAR